ILSTRHPEGHIRHTPALDPPRGTLSHAVGIHQQPQQHVRVIPTPTHHRARGLTSTTTPMKPAGIDLLDHIQQYPHQVLSPQPIPHSRRQQERLITTHRPLRLRHTPPSQPTGHTPSTRAAQLATASGSGFQPARWIPIQVPALSAARGRATPAPPPRPARGRLPRPDPPSWAANRGPAPGPPQPFPPSPPGARPTAAA